MSELGVEIAQISFFLARENKKFESVFDQDKNLLKNQSARIFKFSAGEADCYFAYFEAAIAKENPPWLNFINEKLPLGEAPVFSSTGKSPNGILLLNVKDRIFAATFGRSAASYLERDAFEADFGIKTAMNMCGNEEIRQTRSESHAITLTHIDRQVNKPIDSFAFGLSEAEDLRYISAHMKDHKNITLQGRNSLTMKVVGKEKLSWQLLIEYCEGFLVAYASKEYTKLFPNYKHFDEATESDSTALDEQLITRLCAKDTKSINLGVPEVLIDSDYGFAYSNNKKHENKIYAYLDVGQIFDHIPVEKITVAKLKSKHIFAYSYEEDQVLGYKSWPLYSCLSFEQNLGGKYFVLSDGRWLEVDSDFYKEINNFTKNVLHEEPCEKIYEGIDISDDVKMQNREEIFNKKICEIRPSCVLFDQAKLQIGSGRKDKEFCDILDLTNENTVRIIHCKPYKNASSTNYLFSQAQFYCHAFINDQFFLGEIRNHISLSLSTKKAEYLEYMKPNIADIHGRDYVVCLWLLYDQRKVAPVKEEIPLMAQYELKLMHEHLRNTCKFSDVVIRFIPVVKKNYIKTAAR
ncbi:sporadically distributed protein, TIGR04141 family [Pseudomonas asplenii]|uniref:Sporadically distributed protein, TIGR04141 family n=1 Tax=Pseudomonas asplenii TaxID=53407 RepID=A0A1H6NUS0_9PSED|nr:DUF6119 family protein [Pseudomonas fuscovaginae]SEI17943.1 sporadically distributed protein, TIGR04141 family [Pseudomonas fuscovaginae]